MSKSVGAIVLVCLVFTAGSVVGAEGKGGQGGAFLRIPIGARPAGMGNAFVSISDDANAMYFNPAGLYQIKSTVLGAMYSLMSMDRNHYQGSVVYSHEGVGSFGLMINAFGVSGIGGRDSQGNPTGDFADSEMAASFGYGKRILPFLGVGVGFKYINHSLKDNFASGFGFDFGVHSRIELERSALQLIRLGASISNLGARLRWDTASSHSDEIPMTARVGAGFDLSFSGHGVVLAFEGSQTTGESFNLHVGVEAYLYRTLALRLGLDAGDMVFGTSLRYKLFQLDYAFCPDVLEEGATSRIGIQVVF